MIKLNVTLLWRTDDLREEGMEAIEGVWGRASFVMAEDDLIEAAEIEEEIRMNKNRRWEWAEYSSQREEVCDAIGYWAEQKGNLPSGIPICGKLGSPCEIKFTSYDVVDEDSIIYLEDEDLSNPLCQCPKCGTQARIMDGFSILAHGFNGIETGSADDVNKQECGNCQAQLEY